MLDSSFHLPRRSLVFYMALYVHFFLALSLLPPLAFAAGAEDTEYLGLNPNNQLVRLKFVSDPASWSNSNFIYGSMKHRKLRYCWLASTSSTKKATGELALALSCTHQAGAKASVSFLPILANTDTSKLFTQAARRAKLIDSQDRGGATLTATYQCKTGCDSNVPRLIFEVTHYD